MATNRIRRTRKFKPSTLPKSLVHYLLTGEYARRDLFPDCPGFVQTFMLSHPNEKVRLRQIWLNHKSEVLAEWKKRGNTDHCWAEREFGNV